MSTVNNHKKPEVSKPPSMDAVLLLKILYGLKPAPSANLIKILKGNANKVLSTTKDTIEEMSSFIRKNYGTNMTYGNTRQTSRYNFERKLRLTQILYYKMLESIVSFEMTICQKYDTVKYLNSKVFQKSLYACCLDIIFLICRYNLKFPRVLSCFSIYSYEFYGVIELIVRAESHLPKDIVKYLNWMEQEILEYLMWKSDSPVWKEINVSDFSIPAYQATLAFQSSLHVNELKVCDLNNDIENDIGDEKRDEMDEESEKEIRPVINVEIYEMDFKCSESTKNDSEDHTSRDHVQSGFFDICYNDKGIPSIISRFEGDIDSDSDSDSDLSDSDESDSCDDSDESESYSDSDNSYDSDSDNSDSDDSDESEIDSNSDDSEEDSDTASSEESGDSEDDDDEDEVNFIDVDYDDWGIPNILSEIGNDDDKDVNDGVTGEDYGNFATQYAKLDKVCYKFVTSDVIAFKKLMVDDLPEQKRIILTLLFRKFYHLASMRIHSFCDKLHLMDTDIRHRIWTCFEYMVVNHFPLIRDSHMNILIISSIYTIIKVLDILILLEDVINCHLEKPTLSWYNETPNEVGEFNDIFSKDKFIEFYRNSFLKFLGPANALSLGMGRELPIQLSPLPSFNSALMLPSHRINGKLPIYIRGLRKTLMDNMMMDDVQLCRVSEECFNKEKENILIGNRKSGTSITKEDKMECEYENEEIAESNDETNAHCNKTDEDKHTNLGIQDGNAVNKDLDLERLMNKIRTANCELKSYVVTCNGEKGLLIKMKGEALLFAMQDVEPYLDLNFENETKITNKEEEQNCITKKDVLIDPSIETSTNSEVVDENLTEIEHHGANFIEISGNYEEPIVNKERSKKRMLRRKIIDKHM